MRGDVRSVVLCAVLAGCRSGADPLDPLPHPDDADLFSATPGAAAPLMSASYEEAFERGRDVLLRPFATDEGLGPTFNADSCAGCHQVPAAGGSAPRYRDFFLVREERSDGVLVDAGTNGEGPVLNLYATREAGSHIPPSHATTVYARRNAPSGLGVGWLRFVPDAEILLREDPEDADGDGISGRANYEQGRVGRFGYKAQATDLESFNRGAAFNQMGVTTDPLYASFPEDPEAADGARSRRIWDLVISPAHAQVAAPDEPTVDADGVVDPEMSDADQLDLLVYSTYVAAPAPRPFDEAALRGAEGFEQAGCVSCHLPRLQSTVGPIRAYTDLLLHDLGADLADGIGPGLATGSEFRTAPLWGVSLHPPYLHDGRADTLAQAIEAHGGEGAASAEAWGSMTDGDQADLLAFLEALAPNDPSQQVLALSTDDLPEVGTPGGPDVALSVEESTRWARGRALFDRTKTASDGLGAAGFNADSCRACHQDPVLGGAGGIDVSVIRYGRRDATTGAWSDLDRPVHPRVVLPGEPPHRMPDEANVVALRQSPTILGAGRLDRIEDRVILANADPDDADADGVAGVARVVGDRVGRFGWKAQIGTLQDFVYDALFQEIGLTGSEEESPFAIGQDEDGWADPEFTASDAEDLAFYLSHLAPPAPGRGGPDAARGEVVFSDIGCDRCHLPVLGGVPAWTDLLVHEVADAVETTVDQDPGASPTAFRTPPLWGVADTAPYLHDGSAPTLRGAVLGHGGTATASRQAFETLSSADQLALVDFLKGL